ncbi:MAG TPA: hypothetical protein VK436_00985 [Methanocella sp.]|nr:hypothetical protein [Methanocella sp.]
MIVIFERTAEYGDVRSIELGIRFRIICCKMLGERYVELAGDIGRVFDVYL